MSEETVRKIYESVKDRWGNLANYIVIKNVVKRFCELNPTADPFRIDWAEHYRPDFEYDEILRELKKAYPMYKWGVGEEFSEEQYFSELYSYLVSQARELPEELRLKLIRELQAEFGFEEPKELEEAEAEVQKVESIQEVEVVEEKPVINLRLIAKYPAILEESKKIASTFTIDKIPREAYQRALTSIIEAIRHGIISTKLDNPVVEILSKPLMYVITALMPSPWLKSRVALAEALRMEKELYVDSVQVFNLLVERINDHLGYRIEKTDEHGEYKMYFIDYLKAAKPLLSEPRWKMVNKTVHRGYVFLNRAEVIRLIRSIYQQIILNKIMNINPRDVPEDIKRYAENVKQKIYEEVMKVKGVSDSVQMIKDIPPCIKNIMEKLSIGDDVSHLENFTIASYMLNIGKSVEEVLELFKNRADYDEKIARYQIEHIAGMRGSRIKYKPPSCEKLRTVGICRNSGECPKWIKNPLNYNPIRSDSNGKNR